MNPNPDSCVSGGMDGLIIKGAWYSETRRQLDLMFASGKRYRYLGVPIELARRFASDEAKGRFFNREIRNRYRCQPLDEPLPQAA